MPKSSIRTLFAAAAVLCSAIAPASAEDTQQPKANIDFLKIDADITLRRMVVHNPRPKGTVLFLHGFPETLYAGKMFRSPLAMTTRFMLSTGQATASHQGQRSTDFPMHPRTTRAS